MDILIVDDELLSNKFSWFKLTVTDHQTKMWETTMKEVQEMIPWWLDKGINHKLENCVLSRDMLQERKVMYYDELAEFIKNSDEEFVIITTCLTHNGKSLKMIMSTDEYKERF
jgi:hypothetical protein